MLCMFLGIGILYTIKLDFVQIRHFRLWWNCTFMSIFSPNEKSDEEKISPFQAMATALAGAIGTGNIVGVAGAVTLGGPGAIFWMWVAAFFGMATIYAENVLGVMYREKRNGAFVGGPMYYIEKGLHCRYAAIVFALLCTAAALGMGNMTQSNSIAGALKNGFGISPGLSGIIIAVSCALIIFGGIGRIAKLTEKLVPAMAVIYIAAAIIVIAFNIRNVPNAFVRIFICAFDIRSAAAGFTGYGMAKAVKYGISRGVFSNEAGLGSSPIVHAAADTEAPYRQGMWGIFQVFTDTIVMCTLMALCIITSYPDDLQTDSIVLCSNVFYNAIGPAGKMIINVSIILFAFATLVSWCYYGEKSLEYLTEGKYISVYRLLYCCAAYIGSIMSISLVWEISDTLNGLMAVPNLAALILLSGKINGNDIKKLSRKTCKQKENSI